MRTIHLKNAPHTPNAEELREVMEQVSKDLGTTWTAVEVNGAWKFYLEDRDLVLRSRKVFMNALSDAVNLRSDEDVTIVNEIPF